MEKELITEFDNPDYPVYISFVEKKMDEAERPDWSFRKDEMELIIVNNGDIKVTTEYGTTKVGTGQGIMINCDVRHYILSSKMEDTAFFSVVFSPGYALDISKENTLAKKYYYPILHNKDVATMLLDESNLRDESAIDKINDIIAVNTSKKPGYEILTKGYLCMLWGMLVDYLNKRRPSFNGMNVPSQDELRVRSAIAYMEENFYDNITLESIAKKIHVSRNECCRCFKRVLQASPVDFLIRLRVFEAAKVLYKDPLSVDSVAELGSRCGFNNASYFNKMFKRHFECSPTEFSKMLKTDSERARKLYDAMQESVTCI